MFRENTLQAGSGTARRRGAAARHLLTAVFAVVALALSGLAPWAATASAATAGGHRSAPTHQAVTKGHPGSVEKARLARARAEQLKTDRALVRSAPRGIEAFVLWLRAIGARSSAGPLAAPRVQSEVAQLDRMAGGVKRDLTGMSTTKAQALLMAVVRTEVKPAMDRTHAAYVGNRAFFFYTSLQRHLEQFGRAAGTTGGVTFLPALPSGKTHTLASYNREFVVDQDGDGVSDAFDDDIDGTGGANPGDRADNMLGIPDEFLIRSPMVAGLVSGQDGQAATGSRAQWRSCFAPRESIPRLMTVRAATRLQNKRECGTADKSVVPAPKVPPGNTTVPSVTGSAVVGATLTAQPGEWAGNPAPKFTYRWQYLNSSGGWPDINGATSQSYTLTAGDLGHQVRVNVTAKNTAGSAEQISSVLGPVTNSGASAPTNVGPPTVTGNAIVGGQLTATQGSWTGSPTSFAYQWQRGSAGSWTSIDQATGQAYTPGGADVGSALRVQVTASSAAGQASATSTATTQVPDTKQPPANTQLPAISGKPVVGSALTTTSGGWTGSPTFDYSWQRSTSDGGWAAISGASSQTYTPVRADVGLSLRVSVTADGSGGSATVQSSQVGPVTNVAGACDVSPTTDTDGDGVPDCTEIAGFNLVISTTGTGATVTRHVTSNPNLADTDGDGISDGLEWQGSASDPSSTDTDGDGLSDYQEFIVYKSLPANVDSDGDAVIPGSNPRSADPRLLDGSEVNGYAFAGSTISTSPVLADTDGDSLSDYTEINSGGFNPLVADMPKLQVGVPDNAETNIQIFTTHKDGTASTTYKGTTTASDDSTKTHTVDLTNVKTLHTNSTTLDAGAKGGQKAGKPFGEAHLNVKSTWQSGTVTDQQTGSTTDTEHTSQQTYQQYQSDVSSTDNETASTGTLSTAITLQNTGTVSYTVKNLTVTAFRADPDNPGSIQPIATLTPASSVGDITLAPNDTEGPIQVSATDVSSDLLVDLLANPNGIIYSIPSPQLVNPANGVNYATIGQNVEAQTAGVTIDDGTDQPKTYLVATNVARTPKGASAGVDMGTVMASILHQDYQTCTQKNPDAPDDQTQWRQVLCQVGSVATTDVDHFWSLLTSTDLPLGAGDFDKLQLQVGSAARLVYLVDSDGDGLFDAQEGLYGTDIDKADTDGDGISDFDETETGWTVPAIGPNKAYQVFSSPVATDLDGDGAWDGCPTGQSTCGGAGITPETVRLTDPNLPDTNGDGLSDGQQSAADALAYCPGCFRVPGVEASLGNGPGVGDGQFGADGPGALGVNPTTEEVYVADASNNRIEKFGADGKFDLAFGSAGSSAGQFQNITGVAVDRQGNVYVTDQDAAADSGRLQKFTSSGAHVATVSVIGYSVAVDSAGLVYVHAKGAGPASHYLQKYGPTLNLLSTTDEAPPFPAANPDRKGPVLTAIAVDPGGSGVLVASGISVFGSVSSFLQLMVEGKTPVHDPDYVTNGPLYEGVAIDRVGHVYLSNTTDDTVRKAALTDPYRTTYATLGGTGTGPTDFSTPVGVAVDDDCSVYVSDSGNDRVQKLTYATGCG
jgi:hypothetical protein